MHRIYLAHSAHERPKGKRLAQRISNLGYDVYNPFYDVEDTTYVDELDNTNVQDWDVVDPIRSKWVVVNDLRGVRSCDSVICVFPRRRTVGISCEMTYAWMNHIPVYSVVPDDMKGHPWIVEMSNKVYTDIEDLMRYLSESIRPMVKKIET